MIEVTPTASEDEMAAILAAYELLWSSPPEAVVSSEGLRWRFAGRDWVRVDSYGGWA